MQHSPPHPYLLLLLLLLLLYLLFLLDAAAAAAVFSDQRQYSAMEDCLSRPYSSPVREKSSKPLFPLPLLPKSRRSPYSKNPTGY